MSRFTNKLQNQTILIIGGTGGVGMGVAAGSLEFGANVIITSSRQSRLDSQLSTLRSQYPNTTRSALTGFTCDLASTEVERNLQSLLDQVQTHLATELNGAALNHLIYTAGDKLPTAPLESITQSTFHSALQVRATSCLLAVKTFVGLLPKSNRSTVTFTGGSICDKPLPGGWSMLAFIAAGLNGMTRQLAADLAPIRVNGVAPGVVDTDLWADMGEDERRSFYDRMETSLPTGAVGRPDDVAEAYLYLMRDANVTGATLHTNAGAFL